MSRRLLRNHAAQAFLTIVACFAVSAPAASAANQPAMHFDSHMQVVPVCFSVTNPAGGQSALFGLRYTDSNGPVAPTTPAIVLVHGIASSTEDWDFSPSWSAARALAAAGYVVFSYDRLGYAASSYFDHPGGGYTLTTQAARDELHQLVGEVKSGGYTTTSGADCSGAQTPSTLSNHTVVIVGPRIAQSPSIAPQLAAAATRCASDVLESQRSNSTFVRTAPPGRWAMPSGIPRRNSSREPARSA